jgi:Cu+-exporting ATPase
MFFARDPVCGMLVRRDEATVARRFAGHTYYFCSEACVTRFSLRPESYTEAVV